MFEVDYLVGTENSILAFTEFPWSQVTHVFSVPQWCTLGWVWHISLHRRQEWSQSTWPDPDL